MPRLLDMAGPAKGLKASHVERVLPWPATQRRDVIALKPPGLAAHDTSPAVALEDGPTHGVPAASVQVGVVSTHVLLYWISYLRGRPAGLVRVVLTVVF